MKMKRFFVTLLTMMITLSTFGLTALAEETQAKSADVCVTIADKGQLVVVQEKVTVKDIDGDEEFTINDALFAVHEAKYEGGAASGYGSAETEWGLSITKLWGDESGNFGYRVNNESAWSLVDPVVEGDCVNAFVYSDGEYYSDAYSFFDKNVVETKADAEVTLALSYAGYDADWNPVVLPVANATITIDGAATEYKTDAEGKVTIKIAEAGTRVISATSDTQLLVPPVCVATVKAVDTITYTTTNATTDTGTNTNQSGQTSPKTGDSFNAGMFVMLGFASCVCVILSLGKRKNAYEK